MAPANSYVGLSVSRCNSNFYAALATVLSNPEVSDTCIENLTFPNLDKKTYTGTITLEGVWGFKPLDVIHC